MDYPSLRLACLKRVLRSTPSDDLALELGVSVFVRIVLGVPVEQSEIEAGHVETLKPSVFETCVATLVGFFERDNGRTEDPAITLRLECLDFALARGNSMACVKTLQERVNYFFHLVLDGQEPSKPVNPGNPKKRPKKRR